MWAAVAVGWPMIWSRDRLRVGGRRQMSCGVGSGLTGAGDVVGPDAAVVVPTRVSPVGVGRPA